MKRSTWSTEHVLLLLMSGGFFIHLVSVTRYLRDDSSRVGDVVSRPVDAALFVLMLYCAVGLTMRSREFARTYDMRSTWRKVGYWLITAYVIVSLPGHVGFLATGDTRFFDAFPWWFSLVVLGVYVLIVAYVLTLRRLPDAPLDFTVATDGAAAGDSVQASAIPFTPTLPYKRSSVR